MAVDYQSSFLDSCSSHGSWTAAQPSWAHVRFGSYFHPCTWHWFIATNACCNVWRALIFSLVEPYGTNLKGSPQESTTRCPCRTISRWSLVKHCWYDQQQTTKLAFNQKYSVYLWGRKVSFHTCTHTHTHTHTRARTHRATCIHVCTHVCNLWYDLHDQHRATFFGRCMTSIKTGFFLWTQHILKSYTLQFSNTHNLGL